MAKDERRKGISRRSDSNRRYDKSLYPKSERRKNEERRSGKDRRIKH